MAELLIEILCEEIPAKLQKNALEQTRQLFSNLLDEYKLTFNKDNLKTFISPRRMTLVVENLSKTSKAMVEEKRGPKTTAPLPAIQGFLKANNLSSVEELVVQNDYYFAHLKTPPQTTQLVIPKVLEAFFANFKWSKSMYWGQGSQSWIRPIRNILCIFDEKPVEHYFDKLELISNNKTFGHRFLDDNKCLEVKSFNDYQKQLKNHHVIFDQNERKKIIERKLQELSDAKNLLWQKDDDLLEEVVGLTEYPCVEICKIDEKFLELPPIVITTCMKNHQKYFSFADANNQSITHFGIVSNVSLNDKNLAGFTKVLKARLTDALFFYHQDLKTPLINLLPKLNNIQVQEKLGSVGDMIKIITAVARNDKVKEVAKIYKCDLLTNMVGEFPELQGIMGAKYAKLQAVDEKICNAILNTSYRFPSPEEKLKAIKEFDDVSLELYILDRLYKLVGFVGIGIKPTGSKDPYALRRAATEIVEVIINHSEYKECFKIGGDNGYINALINQFKDNKIILSNDTEKEVLEILENSLESILMNTHDNFSSNEKKKYIIKSCFKTPKLSLFIVARNYRFLESAHKDLDSILQILQRCSGIIPKEYDDKYADRTPIDIYEEYKKKYPEPDKSNKLIEPIIELYEFMKDFVWTIAYNRDYEQYLKKLNSIPLNDFLDNVQVVDPKDEKKTEQNILLLVLLKKLMLEFYNFELILQ
jgi:glycyl-tRNA synthetase beta chain